MYDPNIGRWMEEDPVGFAAGDPNLYRYVGNDPTNMVDPSGEQAQDVVAQVLKETKGANLKEIPGRRLNSMVEQGLAERNKSGYVYVKFVAPTSSYNLLYEPMKKVFVNKKKYGTRITNHYSIKYRSLLGEDYSPGKVAYYELVYMGNATRLVKNGIHGNWTTIDPADGPNRGENVERQWRIDRNNREHEAALAAKSEFFRGLVPFRNTIKYWNQNSAFENTLNLSGDVLLFLGPLFRVFAGANTARQVLRITIAAEAALGAARASQGVYDLTYGDGKNAARFFGEAALRLLGVTAATLQLLKIPKIPQGLTEAQFNESAALIHSKAGHLGGEVVVQGSRAAGTAKAASDIDFAIRVSKEEFDALIKASFGSPNPGSAKFRTMQHAIETGKIQAGEAKLHGLRVQLQDKLGMKVDISVIRKDGPFDRPPFISVPKPGR